MKTEQLFDNQAIESFDKLKEFIEENDFVNKSGEYICSISEHFSEIMEIMGFKSWITLDVRNEKNKIWMHPSGLYAVDYNDGENFTFSSVVVDQKTIWMKSDRSKISYPTEHGYKVIESLVMLKDFSTIKKLYDERQKLKNVMPVSEWTVEMFSFMASRFSLDTSEFVKTIKSAKNDVFHSKSIDKYVDFINTHDKASIRFSSTLNKNIYFTLAETLPSLYAISDKAPPMNQNKDIKILNEYLRGNLQIDWHQVKDVCEKYSWNSEAHPLGLNYSLISKLNARTSVALESKEFIKEKIYPQIKKICNSTSLEEAEKIWDINGIGHKLFKDSLLINIKGLEILQFILEQFKENVGLSFISNKLFNFQNLYNNDEAFLKDLSLALVDNEDQMLNFENILSSFFLDYPEFFKNSEENKSELSIFLGLLLIDYPEDTAKMLNQELSKVWKEYVLQKNLSFSQSQIKSPRF